MNPIASRLPEPEDGTFVVLVDREYGNVLAWRDDETAHRYWARLTTERWFTRPSDLSDGDPIDWRELTETAVKVYVVPREPTVDIT